jgi:predicted O-methyltransferase YrrM
VLPPRVEEANAHADRLGFTYSCDPGTGRLLATLAAAVPPNGRILELGTGVGAGCGWILHGLGDRTDVEVVSVESDEANARAAAEAEWPTFVRMVTGDALEVVPTLGTFDLIFPDAPAGKWTGLRRTLEALKPGGVLVVDDMIPAPDMPQEWKEALVRTRERLLANETLVCVEIDDLTGVILATKRRDRVA